MMRHRVRDAQLTQRRTPWLHVERTYRYDEQKSEQWKTNDDYLAVDEILRRSDDVNAHQYVGAATR